MFRNTPSQTVACGLAFLLFAGTAYASTFAVTPVRVTLSTSQPTGSLTLRNENVGPTSVQLEVLEWSQSNGKEVLKPTRDILATPPIFTIPRGGTQVVRVGLRRPFDSRRELTYRLFLRELPSPPDDDFTGLRIALNISLPVFVFPTVEAVPVLQWEAVRAGEDGIMIRVSNTGNAHVKVANFRLALAGGTDLGTLQVADYVLAGEGHAWPVAVSVPAGSVMLLVAQTDAGEFQAEIILVEH